VTVAAGLNAALQQPDAIMQLPRRDPVVCQMLFHYTHLRLLLHLFFIWLTYIVTDNLSSFIVGRKC